MAAFTKFNLTVEDWLKAVTNYSSDTFKAMLTNTAPVATNHVYADMSAGEVANGGGYTTGGATITMGISNTTGTENVTATAASPTWTGSGGGMGPFRYVAAYDSTPVTKTLQGWWDYGSSISLNSGDTFTISWASGFLTLA